MRGAQHYMEYSMYRVQYVWSTECIEYSAVWSTVGIEYSRGDYLYFKPRVSRSKRKSSRDAASAVLYFSKYML